MRRGIGRLRAGGSSGLASILAPIFAAGGKGIWIDPTFVAGSTQDSAGTTPITASGQLAGKWLDRSGNGNHLLQSTSAARPEWDVIAGISSLFHDRVDDGMTSAVVGAGTYGAAMDVYMLLNRSTTNQMVACSQTPSDLSKYFGVLSSGTVGSGTACSNMGAAWTCFVSAVQVGGTATTSADALHTAIGSGSYKLMAFRDLDMSTWTQFTMSLYVSFMLGGDVGQLVATPAQSASVRASLTTKIGALGGLSI